MIPVPEVTELRQVPVEFLPFDLTHTSVARPSRQTASTLAGMQSAALPAGDPGIGALMRFKSMMAAEGQTVHLARLCYDKLYAYERIAVAHASNDETLRCLALELFQIYHRRESAGRPV